MICKLCRKNAQLVKSHIIPERFYKPLKNEKNHFMGIHGMGGKGWKALQSGLKETLLCFDCEQLLNDRYEKPFYKMWFGVSPIPQPFNFPEPYILKVNYKIVKMMHMSILYRAHVSRLNTFSDVNLGPHAERIRKMLVDNDAGTDLLYPIAGVVLLDSKRFVVQLVSCVQRFRFEGINAYRVAYGGLEWWCLISSQSDKPLEAMRLKQTGNFPVISTRWENLNVVRAAHKILTQKNQ